MRHVRLFHFIWEHIEVMDTKSFALGQIDMKTKRRSQVLYNKIIIIMKLNTHTLMEAGVSTGSAALATEGRKHRANDAGWLCVPLVAETYGAWGNEDVEAFSQLALGLPLLHATESAVLGDIYGRLNLHLVRANATAVLTLELIGYV